MENLYFISYKSNLTLLNLVKKNGWWLMNRVHDVHGGTDHSLLVYGVVQAAAQPLLRTGTQCIYEAEAPAVTRTEETTLK